LDGQPGFLGERVGDDAKMPLSCVVVVVRTISSLGLIGCAVTGATRPIPATTAIMASERARRIIRPPPPRGVTRHEVVFSMREAVIGRRRSSTLGSVPSLPCHGSMYTVGYIETMGLAPALSVRWIGAQREVLFGDITGHVALSDLRALPHLPRQAVEQ